MKFAQNLRRQILAADPVRVMVRAQARAAALEFDKHWSAGIKSDPGPIDVIDMFSGCGGMSAGFVAANAIFPAYRLAAAVEIDGIANASYERNFGLAPHAQDVAALATSPKQISQFIASTKRRESHPLVLIGCAPCQGFSSHRNAEGIHDKRNSLIARFTSIATQLNPDVVIMENVPELLTDRYWPVVRDARAALVDAGYFVHISIHNTAGFGVPQERFRTLILAMKHPFEAPRAFLTRDEYRTVRSAIAKLPPVAAGVRDPNDEMHYSAGHSDSTVRTIRAVPKDGGSRPSDVGPECLRRIASKQGRGGYDDVYGRLYWDKPAITITAYSRNPASGRFIHPVQDRGLTVREAALLQGFPRDYWFAGSLDERFRQIGNAVPPVFSTALALHVLGELVGKKQAAATSAGITTPVGSSFSRLIPSLKAGTREHFA
jgi:DNA (cytosine-5)-methyltransferase 1